MTGTTTGQTLGAAAIGGVALLPYTGNNPLYLILPLLSISLGIIVLSSLVITRILRKVIQTR